MSVRVRKIIQVPQEFVLTQSISELIVAQKCELITLGASAFSPFYLPRSHTATFPYFSLLLPNSTVFSCCHVLTTPYQHTVVFTFHSLSNPKSQLFHSVPFSLVTLTKSLNIPTRCVLGYPKPLTTNCKLSALGINRYSLLDAAGFLTDIRSRISTAK